MVTSFKGRMAKKYSSDKYAAFEKMLDDWLGRDKSNMTHPYGQVLDDLLEQILTDKLVT
jgi:hypothetical protein